MDARTQKMQAKVAKILRQAEDVAGTPEEGVFQARAFEIIAKYGLDMNLIQAQKEGLDVQGSAPDAIVWEVQLEGKYLSNQALLLHGIAKTLHCSTVYASGKGYPKGYYRVYIFGVPVHLDRVKFLWEILQPQMLRLVENIQPENGFRDEFKFNYDTNEYELKSTGGRLRAYRRAWIAGFASEITSRLRQQEQKAVNSGGSTAMVLYSDDKARADQAQEAQFPQTKKVRRRTNYDQAGMAHGKRDAANAAMAHALAG